MSSEDLLEHETRERSTTAEKPPIEEKQTEISPDSSYEAESGPLYMWLDAINLRILHTKLSQDYQCNTLNDLVELVADDSRYFSVIEDIREMDGLTDTQRFDFSRACAKMKANALPQGLLEIAQYFHKFQVGLSAMDELVSDIDQHTETSKEVIDGMIDQCKEELNLRRNEMRAKLDQIAMIKRNLISEARHSLLEQAEEAQQCLETSFDEMNAQRSLSDNTQQFIKKLERDFRVVDATVSVQAEQSITVDTEPVIAAIQKLKIPASGLDALIRPRRRSTILNIFESGWSGRYKARELSVDQDTSFLCKVESWGGFIRTQRCLDKHGISAWNVQFLNPNRNNEPQSDCFLGIVSADWKDHRRNPRELDQFVVKSDGTHTLFGGEGWKENQHSLFNGETVFEFLWRVEFDADEGYLTFYRIDRTNHTKERMFDNFTRHYDARVPDVGSRSKWAPAVRLFGVGVACSISYEEY